MQVLSNETYYLALILFIVILFLMFNGYCATLQRIARYIACNIASCRQALRQPIN